MQYVFYNSSSEEEDQQQPSSSVGSETASESKVESESKPQSTTEIIESKEDEEKGSKHKPSADSPLGLSSRQIWLIMFGLMLGLFIAFLDFTIVSTALPAITAEFGQLAIDVSLVLIF